jgi:hypothetical protein
MNLRKLGAAAVGACLCTLLSLVPSQARPVGTVGWMPFFGLPYPFGYVYHRPRMECYAFNRTWDPLQGWQVEIIWICGAPVRAKY